MKVLPSSRANFPLQCAFSDVRGIRQEDRRNRRVVVHQERVIAASLVFSRAGTHAHLSKSGAQE